MWMTIWINSVTLVSVLFIAFMIGKFFCIGFCETIYDSIDDEDDFLEFFITFGVLGIILLCPTWIGYVYNIKFLLVFCGGFGTIFNTLVIGILLLMWISKCVVPWFEEVHNNIKYKKHGRH